MCMDLSGLCNPDSYLDENALTKHKPTIFIKGRRLYLRPIFRDDIQLFLRWTNDPDLRCLYLNRKTPIDESEGCGWVTEIHKRGDNVTLVICLNDERPIGLIALERLDWTNRVASTALVIGEKDLWGKGYGSEAKLLLLHYAFDTLNLRKIYATVYDFNERSKAYNKKCGYKVEGVQKQAIFQDGRYHDRILLAVFREDWFRVWTRFQKCGEIEANP